MTNKIFYTLILALQAAIMLLCLNIFSVNDYPFHADETDYQLAIEAGFINNSLDQNSPATIDLLISMIKKVSTGGDTDFMQDHPNSENALRHFHGPAGFYPYIIIDNIFGSTAKRLVPIILILIFSAIWILFNKKLSLLQHGIFLLVTSLLLISSKLNFLISPHLSYLFLAMFFLWLISNNTKTSNFLAVVVLSLAVAALEFASVLVMAWLFSYIQINKKLPLNPKTTLKIALQIIFCLILIWPAGIINLNLFFNYIVYLGLALLSDWYRFYDSVLSQNIFLLVLASLVFLANAYYILQIKKQNLPKEFLVFAWYTILMFIVNIANNFVYQVYLVQTLVPGLLALIYLSTMRTRKLKNFVIAGYFVLSIFLMREAFLSTSNYTQGMRTATQLIKSLAEYKQIALVGYSPSIAKVNLKADTDLRLFPEEDDLTIAVCKDLAKEHRVIIRRGLENSNTPCPNFFSLTSTSLGHQFFKPTESAS